MPTRRCVRNCVFVLAVFIAPTTVLGLQDRTAPDPLERQEIIVAGNPARKNAALAEHFAEQVLPLLKANCFKCHSGDKQRGGLSLDSREGLLNGGDSGPAIDVDDPGASLLLEAIRYESFEMPPSGKLADDKVSILTKWVQQGAAWTPGEELVQQRTQQDGPPEVNEQTRAFWSFQPIQRPSVPVATAESPRSPVDAFVWRKLQEQGLKPAPPADKIALLRRAYYNLIGLPPSPAEVEAFLADDTAEAFERVVDRLLESPHYGERWGRHWLDLVRFAESNSYERDNAKPQVWKYRDYVIRSFNNDKPYDDFIIEQLAGDEIEGRTAEQLIATGYYRLGIWDDEPVDPEQARYDDLDDILTTTSQVFLGLTLNCSRCHSHKLDPLPQRDYYRFLAFFQGLNRFGVRGADSVRNFSLRIPDPDAAKAYEQELKAYNEQIDKLRKSIAAIEKTVKSDFVEVEHEEFKHDQHREPLAKKRVPDVISPQQFDDYVSWRQQLKELRDAKPQVLEPVLCVTETGSKPRETHVLIRGNPQARGEQVAPGFPEVLGVTDPTIPAVAADAISCGRRTLLAKWIASPDNPLTARVLVNRVWQYHFGRGIVGSPNNFGLQGETPTHPELLDWLAAEFVDGGWRLKRLHKLMMLSQAYQMSSRSDSEHLAKDPENRWLWRFSPRRLAAEEIRDSILAVNGTLNPAIGGPSIYPEIPAEVLAGQSRPGSGWGKSAPSDQARRSVYVFIKRSLLVPVLSSFDAADTDFTCPVRFASTQPTQALLMLNSRFSNQQARAFAEYLRQEAGPQLAAQVSMALFRVTQRPPSDSEIQRGVAFVERLEQKHQLPTERALEYYCLLALNLNEFVYLD